MGNPLYGSAVKLLLALTPFAVLPTQCAGERVAGLLTASVK